MEYKCNSSDDSRRITCTSDGTWTELRFVCGGMIIVYDIALARVWSFYVTPHLDIRDQVVTTSIFDHGILQKNYWKMVKKLSVSYYSF